jgi:hypothetical protein
MKPSFVVNEAFVRRELSLHSSLLKASFSANQGFIQFGFRRGDDWTTKQPRTAACPGLFEAGFLR